MVKYLKRLGILSVYDRDGIIDRYIEYLAYELKAMLQDLIIVVNGYLRNDEAIKLKSITNIVIYRDNIGFDGGAYKDILVHYLTRESLHQYDELVLCNDTCYGPFVSFEDIWNTMAVKDVDFWGMNYIDNGLTNHMQGYFLVFRKNLLESDTLYNYFYDYIDENCSDIHEIIATYEKGLWKFLVEKGYSFASYIECNNLDMYKYGNILIRKYGFPFLKKKCFNSKYNNDKKNMADSLIWIKNNTNYDIDMVIKNSKRLYNMEIELSVIGEEGYLPIIEYKISGFKINRDELKNFIERAKDIYIYGCGKYGKEIYFLYLKGNNKFRGFIVSDNEKDSNSVLYNYSIKTISEIEKSTSIIVAMNDKNQREVMPYINQKWVICIL